MVTLTANEAKTKFGELIDTAQRTPVQITRRERVVGVVVSYQDYEEMRVFYADRLRRTLEDSAKTAQDSGLTDERLQDLLSDES